METNSKKTKKEKSIIANKLAKIPIKKLSKQSGFCKRKPKKTDPRKLLIAFLLTIYGSKKNTYSNWAIQLGLLIKDTVSRQALSKRMGEALVKFLQSILKHIMEESVSSKIKENCSKRLKQFNRILIEDSTSIKVDDGFSKEFPGSRNGKKGYAILKIQTTYDVLKRRFVRFDITNFRKNDQSYSPKILKIAKAGDLVIRDLGYFVLKVFKGLSESGVYFLSRLRKGINVYKDENEEKPIDLAKLLRKRGALNADVFIGERERLPARIVAIPVEPQVAASRRRKAKFNRDRRLNPSKRNLFLMGWDIFITNVEKEQLDDKEIVKIYSIRWRIEIIFKCWKSYLEIAKMPTGSNKVRLESFIYIMLIFILLFQVYFYEYYLNKLSKHKHKEIHQPISLMKLMQFVVSNITLLAQSGDRNIAFYKLIEKQIVYHCTYESRNDRYNYNQIILELS